MMLTESAQPYLADDATFDALYPDDLRRVSRRFWTPVDTARRAAALLFETGARHVLDVGSGVGKFALVAGATNPSLTIVGIEQRVHLFRAATVARDRLGLTNVRFVHGNATEASWAPYSGFYFYNSFAENLFDPEDRLDDKVDLSFATFAGDVRRTVAALTDARVGTSLVTFYGSSGRVPSSYELVHQEPRGSGWLRLWVKRHATSDGSFYVEDGEEVVKHDAKGQAAL